MKKLLLLFIIFFASHTNAQTISIDRNETVAAMLDEISADSLKSYIQKMVSFGTRHTLSSQTNPKRGIGAARNYVLGKFKEFEKNAAGRLSSFIDTTTIAADGRRVDRNIVLGNVMAILQGTDPADKRVFIISGHLDSRNSNIMDSTGEAPGANDDASGVAAVIEAARVMSKNHFAATVIFVAVSGEEQGLLGSAFLANKAKKENLEIGAMLNNDIVGSNNSNETHIVNNTQLRVFSEGIPATADEKTAQRIRFLGLENESASRQLARYVKETGERYVDQLEVVLVYRPDRFLRGGDHIPFLKNGFTAVRITEMNENFTRQHQDLRTENGIEYGDYLKHIDFDYLKKNTSVNVAVLASLANAPSPPLQPKMDTKELTNSTLLSWQPPANGKIKGFFVLIRETHSPVWQKKIFTAGHSIRIPYSKDNYLFGVQAVGMDGAESMGVGF
ncbi:MAG: peptidase M28 [Sphingobacteriales bacterium 39-19]|nr:M28 family metallopeptidase [Sphingobacteriales bacterium]OJW08605.1 MAG: peptidase M28 [Sphingobacteriales bacterium 39-19]